MSFRATLSTIIGYLDDFSLFRYWCLVAGYVVVAALFIQLILLPYFLSDYHWGEGLLTEKDAVTYHRISKVLSERINENGFGEWSIKPHIKSKELPFVKSGINGVVSLIYLSVTPRPWAVIPLNAIVHATSALLLVYVFLLLGVSKSWSVLASLPFVLYPSSAQWWSQIGKDGILILGVYLLVWGFLTGINARKKTDYFHVVFGVLSGFCFVWLMRTYMLPIISVASVFVVLVFLMHSIMLKKQTNTMFVLLYGISMIVIAVSSGYAEYQSKASKPVHAERTKVDIVHYDSNYSEHDVLSLINIKSTGLVNKIRSDFDVVKSNSSIDSDVRFGGLGDIILYIPRAAQIGLFAPFPNQWLKPGSSEPNTIMRKVAMFEMGMFYAFFVFLLLNMKWILKNPGVLYVLLVSISIIIMYSLFVTNIGTLYRMRYSFFMIIYGLSVVSFLRSVYVK